MDYILPLLAISLFAYGLTVSAMESKIKRVERKLDLLLQHLGADEPTPAGLERVREQLRQGRQIQAIKIYRELTGAGLKEAKEAVDRLDGQGGAERP
ncbi:ribosomal protein L7/L12 [Actinacidiphila soli]|uniref:ribosomal protein L7/L12 n=1 Tax=Actinacidiphila soli TaxID=2487275 RepID=UPI001F0C2F3B|nr:ribosomal protein L7/L12 [Actinacidiphila soli]